MGYLVFPYGQPRDVRGVDTAIKAYCHDLSLKVYADQRAALFGPLQFFLYHVTDRVAEEFGYDKTGTYFWLDPSFKFDRGVLSVYFVTQFAGIMYQGDIAFGEECILQHPVASYLGRPPEPWVFNPPDIASAVTVVTEECRISSEWSVDIKGLYVLAMSPFVNKGEQRETGSQWVIAWVDAQNVEGMSTEAVYSILCDIAGIDHSMANGEEETPVEEGISFVRKWG